MGWLNREEKDTHLELVVSTNTTRRQWFFSHSLIAIAGSAAIYRFGLFAGFVPVCFGSEYSRMDVVAVSVWETPLCIL